MINFDLNNYFIRIPWHPLYTACQGLIFGIALQTNLLLGIALLPIGVLFHLLFSHYTHQTTLFIFIASLGIGAYQTIRIENRFNQAALAAQKTALYLVGSIVEIEPYDKQRIRITCTICSAYNGKKRVPLLTNWYIKIIQPYTEESLQIGDYIEYKKIYITSPAYTNSYKHYLLQHNCLGITRTREQPMRIYRPIWSIRRWINMLKTEITSAIDRNTNPETAALIKTIFLGKKDTQSPINKKYRKLFQNWGISHYLARSGLHLSMIAFMVEYIARLCIPHFTLRLIILLLITLFYTAISWSSTSYIRALMFLFFLLFATLRRRSPHTLVIFAFVTTTTLLLTPHILFALDFQLSFLLSGMLIWRNHVKFFKSLA